MTLAVDPLGRFLYATLGNATEDIAFDGGYVNHTTTYRIGVNGILSPVIGSTALAGYFSFPIVADPKGRFVYVGNNGSQDETTETVSAYTYSVSGNGDLSTLSGEPFPNRVGGNGTLTPLPPIQTGFAPGSMVVSP